ncbi:MAG: flagellar hook assembly protein FlgD [Myxococcales bacterium]|nr:flagellar hook assembly protein FlgD [Myxococcales bacterium]
MDISALGGPGGIGGGLAADRAQASVDKDAFLKLLVAQISNQDPLAPQETDQYMQQITQFSTLEQMMNLNEGVENLALGQLSNNSQEAVRFVGREVVARGSDLTLDAGGSVPIDYRVDPDAETVTLTIHDEAGEAVKTVEIPAERGGGKLCLGWHRRPRPPARRRPLPGHDRGRRRRGRPARRRHLPQRSGHRRALRQWLPRADDRRPPPAHERHHRSQPVNA